jgi:hypothetical protein
MRLLTTLFVAVACGRAAIISNASVFTFGGVNGTTDCSMQSTGSTVHCMSQDTVVTAEASVVGLSAFVSTSAGTLGRSGGRAEANAGFDDLFVVNSVAGNVLFGHYTFSYFPNFTGGDTFLSFGIQQGGSSKGFSGGSGGQFSLQSTIEPGVPFQERVLTRSQSGTPGSESSQLQVQFLGFTDATGNTVPFQIVADTPEPATWAVTSGGILLVMLFRRRPSRPDAFAKC